MAAEKGSAFLLKIGDGGAPPIYATVAGMRTTQMSVNGEAVNVTTKASGAWRELLSGAGVRSVSVAASGIFTGSAAEARIKANALGGLIDDYELSFEAASGCAGSSCSPGSIMPAIIMASGPTAWRWKAPARWCRHDRGGQCGARRGVVRARRADRRAAPELSPLWSPPKPSLGRCSRWSSARPRGWLTLTEMRACSAHWPMVRRRRGTARRLARRSPRRGWRGRRRRSSSC